MEKITGMSTENSVLEIPTFCDDFRLKVKKTPSYLTSQSDPTSLSLHIPGVRD